MLPHLLTLSLTLISYLLLVRVFSQTCTPRFFKMFHATVKGGRNAGEVSGGCSRWCMMSVPPRGNANELGVSVALTHPWPASWCAVVIKTKWLPGFIHTTAKALNNCLNGCDLPHRTDMHLSCPDHISSTITLVAFSAAASTSSIISWFS